MNVAAKARIESVRTGEFNYLAASTASSLYRNGKVFTRRDVSGNDVPWIGVEMEPRQMPVHDACGLAGAQRRTLEANGFELLRRSSAPPDIDFLHHDQVVRAYYPQCADIVREATGASHVAAFDHNIRSASGKKSKRRIEGGQQVQNPARVVHGDYTLVSAPQRLRDLAQPPTVNDTYRTQLPDGETLLDQAHVTRAIGEGRFAIINLWRSIADEPVARFPLALCDASTVHPDDLVVFEIHYADRVGENYFAKHAEAHRWYYYPAMTREEALLIKQWDSAGGIARSEGAAADAMSPDKPCTFSFHSAFNDAATPADAPDRWSIEVRCAVLYD